MAGERVLATFWGKGGRGAVVYGVLWAVCQGCTRGDSVWLGVLGKGCNVLRRLGRGIYTMRRWKERWPRDGWRGVGTTILVSWMVSREITRMQLAHCRCLDPGWG